MNKKKIILLIELILLTFISIGCKASNSNVESLTADNSNISDTLSETPNEDKTNESTIKIYICGEVNYPGVYEAKENDRVGDIVALAGGLTNQADSLAINQAEKVTDGEKIYIPSINTSNTPSNNTSPNTASNKININTASKEELMTLKGIGESKANDIISYREKNGNFKSIEEIKSISGIKDAAFNKIKDYITV